MNRDSVIVNELSVVPCGTIVKTVIGSIEGMITAFIVRFDKVQYEISYFHDGEQKTLWMNEMEFTAKTEKQSIGFKTSTFF